MNKSAWSQPPEYENVPIRTDNLLTEAEFRQISNLVYRHCRINLHEGKRELVRARIVKRVRAGGFESVGHYLAHVLADRSGQEFPRLIDSLCTNLTGFFRERAHYGYLADRFLPALLAKKHKQGKGEVLAWSAGCSSGEEPYSLAMTLLEATHGRGSWDVRILATDISTRMLRVARAGIYPKGKAATIAPLLRAKHLVLGEPEGHAVVRVRPHVRDLVRFRYLNLMAHWPFRGPFDFIFCRNVMIYFDKPTQQDLVNRFWDRLRPGGLLFTGHSESLTGISHRFEYVQPTIYCRPHGS